MSEGTMMQQMSTDELTDLRRDAHRRTVRVWEGV